MRRVLRSIPVALLLASLTLAFLSRTGDTVPLYAARTGNLCVTCHFDPNGGGPRNDFGFAYARNRHGIEPEPEGSPWRDLQLSNRVGENMPLYVGLNHRFMLLTNATDPPSGIDRFGFFNMENAIHFAFQPHSRLTLVYTLDAFGISSQSATVTNKDAFGMISGFPWNGYVKAGRFRNPFGLRMDDHTVATRNSFLEFSTDPTRPDRFLPYDPRLPDMGVEVGAERAGWYARASFTDGPSSPLAGSNHFAETKTLKFGVNKPWYQSGLSFYDSYKNEPPNAALKRSTRWGYYGMTHYGPLALLGEVAAGTDEAEPTVAGFVTGDKTNLFSYFAELNYTPVRSFNLRARYDHLEFNRASDDPTRDANTHNRYAFETEWVPVPFAELRATVRQIDHQDATLYGHEDETQGYLQFHFSY